MTREDRTAPETDGDPGHAATTGSVAAAGPDEHRQPLLHDRVVALRAPAQVWSGPDGTIGGGDGPTAIDGVYVADARLVSAQHVIVGGRAGEHIRALPDAAHRVRFVRLERHLDTGGTADPDVRSILDREVRGDGVRQRLTVQSRLAEPITTVVEIELRLDGGSMDQVKQGLPGSRDPLGLERLPQGVRWRAGGLTAELAAPGAEVAASDRTVVLRFPLEVPARGEADVVWTLTAVDETAVVRPASARAPWSTPRITGGDDRLVRWMDRALEDLDALRLETARVPGEQFLAAGAPWFLTLFGRDAIWAARFLLPLGTGIAAGTLRVLAAMQGRDDVAATAEQPGKIMHELRREEQRLVDAIVLPPLYYGTVDATALWVCLLADAHRWGLPDDEVRELLPALRAALAWMRDFGDSDGDGLLEYVDETGTGLSNQGWKDSGDSVQWRDGRLAEGPIALCEVQAYAFEAATSGAALLDEFGEPDEGDPWRTWAARLKERFDAAFWIDSDEGAYPAIALDAAKRPVDTVTSNIGHLLGTGLLDERQSALVAARLVSPELDSGYGLRTMSTDSAGYWPTSYHGGAVWTHDTAIAIAGLVRAGHRREAEPLIRGLLAAASGFDYRVPELHSGDAADEMPAPVPYPAACRPQAWSAAAAVAVLAAVLGLEPAGDEVRSAPTDAFGALRVEGLIGPGGAFSVG